MGLRVAVAGGAHPTAGSHSRSPAASAYYDPPAPRWIAGLAPLARHRLICDLRPRSSRAGCNGEIASARGKIDARLGESPARPRDRGVVPYRAGADHDVACSGTAPRSVGHAAGRGEGPGPKACEAWMPSPSHRDVFFASFGPGSFTQASRRRLNDATLSPASRGDLSVAARAAGADVLAVAAHVTRARSLDLACSRRPVDWTRVAHESAPDYATQSRSGRGSGLEAPRRAAQRG